MGSADWDFVTGNWELDSAVYHSEPASLRGTALGEAFTVLCKKTGTTVLNEGRLISWLRFHWGTITNTSLAFFFRNQAAVGTSNRANTYQVWIRPYAIWFTRIVNDVATHIFSNEAYSGAYTFPNNTFVKVRLTWWESGGVLYADFERWTGTEWVPLHDSAHDAVNKWSGAAINRVGILMNHITVNEDAHHDDTEVWGPA